MILKDFPKLTDAREWIFGDAQSKKANSGGIIGLKQSSSSAAFSLTPVQISEAAACFRRLDGHASSIWPYPTF